MMMKLCISRGSMMKLSVGFGNQFFYQRYMPQMYKLFLIIKIKKSLALFFETQNFKTSETQKILRF